MREKILFNDNWMFHLGDIEQKMPAKKGAIYIQAKTERYRFGPASRTYTDCESQDDIGLEHELNPETWSRVNLPHDYIIGQTPKSENNNTLGFFEYKNAWYRKHFRVSEEDKTKRLSLLFEGVATNATIYLNGCLMKHNFCGYNSFEVDITDYVDFDRDNVLAVYIDSSSYESWAYQGAGIYRHVWLVKTELVSVDLWGVYVKAEKDGEDWNVEVENTV